MVFFDIKCRLIDLLAYQKCIWKPKWQWPKWNERPWMRWSTLTVDNEPRWSPGTRQGQTEKLLTTWCNVCTEVCWKWNKRFTVIVYSSNKTNINIAYSILTVCLGDKMSWVLSVLTLAPNMAMTKMITVIIKSNKFGIMKVQEAAEDKFNQQLKWRVLKNSVYLSMSIWFNWLTYTLSRSGMRSWYKAGTAMTV